MKFICEFKKVCDKVDCPHYEKHEPIEVHTSFDGIKKQFCNQQKATCLMGYKPYCFTSKEAK